MKKNVIKRKALPLALSGLLALMCCASNPAWSANDATSFDPTKVEVKAKGTGGVPVGTIIAWPSASQPEDPENWLECDGRTISATDYPELYAILGSTIPNLRERFLEGAMTPNIFKDAGLPNITGNFGLNVGGYRYFGGAFYGGSAQANQCAGEGGYGNYSTNFNAARSNKIYGKSTTVQPASYTVRYIIRALP